jgi:hypothetical protein
MVAAVLFTQPDRHLGPAITNFFQVKGMTEIVVTCDGMEWRNRDAVSTVMLRRGLNAETAVLLLRDHGAPLNLASVPGAIAVAVDDGVDGRIFWFDKDQGVRVEHGQMMAVARALIEGRCCPSGGYHL